jgi:hypothetical protein
MERTRKELEEDKALALDDAYGEFQRHLEDKENQWKLDMQKLAESDENKLASALAAKDYEMEDTRFRCQAEIERSLVDAQTAANQRVEEVKRSVDSEVHQNLSQLTNRTCHN